MSTDIKIKKTTHISMDDGLDWEFLITGSDDNIFIEYWEDGVKTEAIHFPCGEFAINIANAIIEANGDEE